MAEGDTAQDAALEPTIASSEDPAKSDALGVTIAAGDDVAAGAVELPEAAAERYALGDEIGRGGLGTVVRAKDKTLRRQVAIKALHAEGGSARRRFVREALITARLEHPSIVSVHDAGRRPDGSPFYAMKLVRGRPLAAVIDETRDLAGRLALVPTVLAVCDAVAYAHSEHVVHRDLKPHNVLVGEFGETVVIDWGLAKELGEPDEAGTTTSSATKSTETVAGSVLGTPAYMAPEQALGGEVDARADVYALGAMIYHVLVGRPPHDGGSVDEVLDRAVTGAVVPLTTREPGVPRDLAAIVAKAMARRAEDRYATARELAEDLRRFTTGQLVGAHRYTRLQRLRRWLAKHRAIAITVAVAVAIVAAVATISVRDVVRERDRADRQRDVAVAAQARADEQRTAAQAAGNRAVLAQARGAIERDPAEALAWLATLSVDGPGWDAARAIAADALWRDPPQRVMRGHRGTPRGLAVESTAHAVTWDDGAVWLWDLGSGTGRAFAMTRTHSAVLCGDGARILGQGVRPDGAMSDFTIELASGAIAYGTVSAAERTRCGDPPTPMPDDCDLVAATPDGQTIACGDPNVSVRHGLGGAPRILRKAAAHFVAIDDDAGFVAVDRDASIEIYDLARGTLKATFPVKGSIHQLVFGPDAKQLVVVGDHGVVWDLELASARPFGDEGVVAAAFLPDGRIATVATDRALRIWSPRAQPAPIAQALIAAAITDDGKAVVAREDGSLIRLYLDRVVRSASVPAAPKSVAIRGDGTVLASTAAGEIWIWGEKSPPALLGAHRGSREGNDVAWLGDDAVSWNGETVRVWPAPRPDMLSGQPYHDIALPPLPPLPQLTDTPGDILVMPGCPVLDGAAPAIAVDRATKKLAVARDWLNGCDQLTYLIDAGTDRAQLLEGARGRHPAFTPDGRLVTSSADGAILVWDLASAKAQKIEAPLLHPHAAAVSPGGEWIAVSGEGAVALANAREKSARVLEAGEADLLGVWFDDEGKALIVGAESGVWIWDLASGERRHLAIGLPRALRAQHELEIIAGDRAWRIRDDLPRTPADLSKKLTSLGYSLPAPNP
ncbi:MAG TPA: serine/threonine-protein kinase [Kofleriaceae bacterium]|nr:serine/threonine-protein kinase [Kofleriaceae bacterium]